MMRVLVVAGLVLASPNCGGNPAGMKADRVTKDSVGMGPSVSAGSPFNTLPSSNTTIDATFR